MREVVRDASSETGLALTEGHVSFDPRNSNPILKEWLSAVYHARTMNIYQRNGDVAVSGAEGRRHLGLPVEGTDSKELTDLKKNEGRVWSATNE